MERIRATWGGPTKSTRHEPIESKAIAAMAPEKPYKGPVRLRNALAHREHVRVREVRSDRRGGNVI